MAPDIIEHSISFI